MLIIIINTFKTRHDIEINLFDILIQIKYEIKMLKTLSSIRALSDWNIKLQRFYDETIFPVFQAR